MAIWVRLKDGLPGDRGCIGMAIAISKLQSLVMCWVRGSRVNLTRSNLLASQEESLEVINAVLGVFRSRRRK